MKKYDVVALGELLIDFTENGKSNQGNPLFEANPGGAPCNVLAMLTKLGHKTAFIGKVGEDFFGEQLRDAITEVGIDASGLCTDKEIHTTLAMVHTYPDGDRDFSFYRNPGADMMLNKEEICEELIKETKIFHFGTLSMTHEGVREATKKPFVLRKSPVRLFLLTRIYVLHFGIHWMRQKSRCYTVSDIARFLKSLTMRFSG